jgi:hypothetical protein
MREGAQNITRDSASFGIGKDSAGVSEVHDRSGERHTVSQMSPPTPSDRTMSYCDLIHLFIWLEQRDRHSCEECANVHNGEREERDIGSGWVHWATDLML